MFYLDKNLREDNEIKDEVKTLNYSILKLRSKMLSSNLNNSINNLYMFSMDNQILR